MPTDHREIAFEKAIEHHLLANGYESLPDGHFDREQAIFADTTIAFIKRTQEKTWKALETIHGEGTRDVVLTDLIKALDAKDGSLHVIRHGFKCFGKRIQMAFFAPAHGMNPETERLYKENTLGLTRQLHFSPRNSKSLDLVLSINGIPFATAELKNPISGQDVSHARHQYQTDRDPIEKLFEFKKRALVHFAVDPDLVYMTTKLAGKATRFLPFNKGRGHGAGNPDNPNGYRTSYLWEEILERGSILDILARFVHLEIEEKKIGGKKVTKETMIFPRYHQLDCVRKLVTATGAAGPGSNYLVQHSAGSGKSNSIAWLAHRLSSLHNQADEKVFDSVIVITDRVVLDRQLQNTIYQFDHKQGVVQKIDENSTQLAEALKSGTPIIITTLQKFPFVTEKVGELQSSNYAVIVDEAHSSQSGEGAADLKGVLSASQIKEQAKQEAEGEGLPDYEEEVLRTIAKRGKQPNLSFFAFTATPKYKTLKVFGTPGPDGKPEPFHLYSMRQAIEECFILDVLENYTTYKTYYRLIKATDNDPQVEKRKAAKALARFMSLHPHNIAQKAEVMLEHFRTHTQHKIGGKAKAMVVTSSRLHAVRYKQEFDRQIKEKGYQNIRALVAFSGTVEDPDAPGVTYTEPEMNPDIHTGKPIREKELPEKFSGPDYHVLIVAEKYQTGFDQPLLHTMYVDKRLAGIQAVQTLSRLNRTAPGKEDTFVLDFLDQRDEVLASFQPYYERTTVGDDADASQLNTLHDEIMGCQVIWQEDVEKLCQVFFKNTGRQDDHAKLYIFTDPAVGRFKELDEEKQEALRTQITAFRNLYSFLAQIIPYHDSDLEKLYTYLRFFSKRLPKRDRGPEYQFDDEVTLKYYRLQKISEGSIELEKSSTGTLDGPTEVGTGGSQSPEIELSKLIDILNDRFGTEFTPADQLFFDQIREDAAASEELRQAAAANTLENFRFVFDKALEGFFIDRMEQNEELFAKYMNDENFQRLVTEHLRPEVYNQIREDGETA